MGSDKLLRTAVCIASGPSLTREDVQYCIGKADIYAVKETCLICPDAKVLYAADTDWFYNNEHWKTFNGEIWTCSKKAADHFKLNYVEAKPAWNWSETQGAIATGGNSGFQAVNLAYLQGAERIILLGYDMGYNPNYDNKHWFDNEYKRETRDSNYKEWIKRFQKASEFIKIPVFNASTKTNLDCFPRVNLRDIL